MNFQWREGVYDQCALYEELICDDGKVLGRIMRFYEENCPTYAMTETKRLGPKKDDQAARRAVEEAISRKDDKPTLTLMRKRWAIDKSADNVNGWTGNGLSSTVKSHVNGREPQVELLLSV
jgi:hypothetical protein